MFSTNHRIDDSATSAATGGNLEEQPTKGCTVRLTPAIGGTCGGIADSDKYLFL